MGQRAMGAPAWSVCRVPAVVRAQGRAADATAGRARRPGPPLSIGRAIENRLQKCRFLFRLRVIRNKAPLGPLFPDR